MNPRLIIPSIGFALAALIVPGNAHVKIVPAVVSPGGFEELTFRCPNERDRIATTKLVVQLPPDTPIPSVKIRPIPGWRTHVTLRKLRTPMHTEAGDVVEAVDTITWEGGTIEPGEYQDFAILAGPIPSGSATLPFKALQTYANGEVVRWIDLRAPGEPEPRYPAPILTVHA